LWPAILTEIASKYIFGRAVFTTVAQIELIWLDFQVVPSKMTLCV
jgi:hypothetical protein